MQRLPTSLVVSLLHTLLLTGCSLQLASSLYSLYRLPQPQNLAAPDGDFSEARALQHAQFLAHELDERQVCQIRAPTWK